MDALYTCEKCGCLEFILEHLYTQETIVEEFLWCTCEDSEAEWADVSHSKLVTIIEAWGVLTEDYSVEEWEKNELESWSEQDEDPEINCVKCFENASESDWKCGEECETEIVEEEFNVKCAECDCKIESLKL